MKSLQTSTWADIDAFRARLAGGSPGSPGSVEEAAQAFAADLAVSAPTVLLARLFLVLPFGTLPAAEQEFARKLIGASPGLDAMTPTLTLLGSHGVEADWCTRQGSKGHRAIPLLGAAFVEGIPMISRLLSDFGIGFTSGDGGKTLDTRRLLGGRNAAFFVADAVSSLDQGGRQIIPAKEFVGKYGVRTVFGMGGAYVDGTLAVAIVFTRELIERVVVDRFPSLISNFKMATAKLLAGGQLFRK